MTQPQPRITFRGIPTEQLQANRGNVREHLDGIDELAASIRANGILQPLIVNDLAGSLIVTDGHRRLEAARRAGVPIVPCLVGTDVPDRDVTTTMLAAAMHQELRPIEQARAFQRLRDQGVTIADIARSTGYRDQMVRSRLLLLELPHEAQDMLEDDRLTIAQATDLAKQVKRSKSGSTAAKTKKASTAAYFKQHGLAERASLTCQLAGHADTRQLLGGTACPPCFEDAIRHDERGRTAREDAA